MEKHCYFKKKFSFEPDNFLFGLIKYYFNETKQFF